MKQRNSGNNVPKSSATDSMSGRMEEIEKTIEKRRRVVSFRFDGGFSSIWYEDGCSNSIRFHHGDSSITRRIDRKMKRRQLRRTEKARRVAARRPFSQ